MRKSAASLLGMALLSSSARADYDGNEMKKLFDAHDNVGPMMARAYVAVHRMFLGIFFVAENVRLSQARAIVEIYLSDDPEHWYKTGSSSLLML